MRTQRTLLVPRGEFPHPEGTQIIDAAALRRLLNAARAFGRDVPVDYDHEGFFDPSAPRAGSVAASTLEIGAKGLYGVVEWTEEAAEKIRAGEYRHLSPALLYNPAHSAGGALHLERLAGIGLTNRPNMAAMGPLLNNQFIKEETMQEILAKLKAALGLAPETDDTEALGVALERIAATGAEEEAAEGEAPPEPSAADDGGAPTRAEFQALKDELALLRQNRLSEIVNGAIGEGKILPAQREWAVNYAGADPEGFRAFLANSRPAVSLGAIVPPASRSAVALDPDQERVNRLLGIGRDVFEKYNKQ